MNVDDFVEVKVVSVVGKSPLWRGLVCSNLMTLISFTFAWNFPNHEFACSAAEVLNSQPPPGSVSTGKTLGLQ